MKFQQVTAAVMAKGVEDTAFYRYNRLASLNEVGGNPDKFGISVEEFHRTNEERMQSWPHSMLATSTHDSKRSEDVRARIDVLSEIPSFWRRKVSRWRDWNRNKKTNAEEAAAPSRNDEYLLYQTLVGSWPCEECNDQQWVGYRDRIEEYMCRRPRARRKNIPAGRIKMRTTSTLCRRSCVPSLTAARTVNSWKILPSFNSESLALAR